MLSSMPVGYSSINNGAPPVPAEALARARVLIADAMNFRTTDYRTDAVALQVYAFQDTPLWLAVRWSACAAFLFSGFWDAPWKVHSSDKEVEEAWSSNSFTTLHAASFSRDSQWLFDALCLCVFAIDALLRCAFTIGLPCAPCSPSSASSATSLSSSSSSSSSSTIPLRLQSWRRAVIKPAPFHDSPMAARAFAFCCLCTCLDLGSRPWTGRQWSGCFRPAVLFYYSEAARIALTNTCNTVPRIASVVGLEWYLVLVYSCACVLLYGRIAGEAGDSDAPGWAFRDLGWASLSLFSLSTTVNDPDVWLPLYAKNPLNAVLFVSFLVLLLYGVHNLVIATVYDVYAQSLASHARARRDRRADALAKAYDFLVRAQEREALAAASDPFFGDFGNSSSNKDNSSSNSRRRRSPDDEGGGSTMAAKLATAAMPMPFTLPRNSSSGEGSSSSGTGTAMEMTPLQPRTGAPTLARASSGTQERGDPICLSADTLLAVLGELRPHYPEEKLKVLLAMVDKSSTSSISRAAFGPGIALALSKRVSRRDLTSADSAFWRQFSDFLLGVNALSVIVVCEAAGSAALGGDTAASSSPSGSQSDGEVDKDLWIAVVCMVGLALLFIVDLMHQVRREGFRHFMRGGLPHALALASCLASVLILSLAAPHAWNLFVAYHGNNYSSSGDTDEVMAPRARRLVAKLALARCLDMVRLLARVPLSSRIFNTIGRVLPSIKGQAAVIFTVLHFFAWVGMLCWGGGEVGNPPVATSLHGDALDDGQGGSSGGAVTTTSGPESWVGAEPYYYLLNFNSYSESLVTLMALVVVNNWNVLATGYCDLYGPWIYVFFVAFNVFAVTVAMNVMTAFYINAFQIATALAKQRHEDAKRKSSQLTSADVASSVRPKRFHVSERNADEAELLEAMLDSAPTEDDGNRAPPPASNGLVRVQRLVMKTTATSSSSSSSAEAESTASALAAAETLFESPGFAALLAEFKAPPNAAILAAKDALSALPSSSGSASSSLYLVHPLASDRKLRIEATVNDEPSSSIGGGSVQHRTAVFLAHELS